LRKALPPQRAAFDLALAPMSERTGLKKWLWEQRSVARLAYALHMGSRLLSAAMGLVWTKLLVDAMGEKLNGVFL
jgi:hypothetical protein